MVEGAGRAVGVPDPCANYVHNVVDTPCIAGLCGLRLVAVCKLSPKNVVILALLDLDDWPCLVGEHPEHCVTLALQF
jgi:hypothetical protein